jgi:hypothetical protein
MDLGNLVEEKEWWLWPWKKTRLYLFSGREDDGEMGITVGLEMAVPVVFSSFGE